MKIKMITGFTVAGVASVVAASAQADTIAFWNFNSGSSATTGTFSGTTTAVTQGAGTLDLSSLASGTSTVFGGTVTNLPSPAPDGTGRGVALAITGGGTTGGPYPNNGKYMDFVLNLDGCDDLILTYAVQRTATGFTSNAFSVSTDGTTFTPVTTVTGLQSSFGTTTAVPAAIVTVDFSAITALNDDSSVIVRLTLDGATAVSGNNRFDNVLFSATAVPEPASLALLGLGGLLIAARRRTA